MHLNDTGIHTSKAGNTLVNIQAPSLAAYKPAYKILSFSNGSPVSVKTIVLDTVPGFNAFFDLYQVEHNFLMKNNSAKIWNNTVY